MKQVKATVITHSMSAVNEKEIVTFELEFPRIVLAEFNTHNALSKNASSSRAIPVNTMLKQVRENPAFPVRFGAANTGMQDKGLHDGLIEYLGSELTSEEMWTEAAHIAAFFAEKFHEAGYAKQICNRLIEPFQMMKVVMTATELKNFFWLRDHHMADPTIAELAAEIKEAYRNSRPTVLQPGEWHVPYFRDGYWIEHKEHTFMTINREKPVNRYGESLEHALTISSSCCAQVSYRKLDDTYEKAQGVVTRLNLQGEEPDEPVHASPLEHQATPIAASVLDDYSFDGSDAWMITNDPHDTSTWEEGITHIDRDGTFGSGNLKGWIQHRQLVPNHVKRG